MSAVQWLEPSGGGIAISSAPPSLYDATALVSIFGNACSGKSSILNHLATWQPPGSSDEDKQPSFFSGQNDTIGVELVSEPVIIETGDGLQSLRAVAFADTEGLKSESEGDADAAPSGLGPESFSYENNVTLFTSLLVSSRYVIISSSSSSSSLCLPSTVRLRIQLTASAFFQRVHLQLEGRVQEGGDPGHAARRHGRRRQAGP